MKLVFKVEDMSCGHCKMRIEKALGTWGKASSFTVDLAAKRVEVETEAGAAEAGAIIEDAGYSPVPA
jgi:copper chaperone